MHLVNSFLKRGLQYFIFALFSSMVIVTFAQIVARFVFDSSLYWSDELARFSMVWITFLGAAICINERDHTRVDFFIKLFPKVVYHYINVLINVILILFVLIISYYSLSVIGISMRNMTPGLNIPYGYVSLALPVGGLLMVIYLIADSIRWLKKGGDNG